MVGLGVFVDIGRDPEVKTGAQVATGGALSNVPPLAAKNLVKVPAVIKQVLKQTTTRNKVLHNIPLIQPSGPLDKRARKGAIGCDAENAARAA